MFKTEVSVSGSGIEKIMDPDPVCPDKLDPDPVCPERLDSDSDLVCPERLDSDSDPVNIRPDPKPCLLSHNE